MIPDRRKPFDAAPRSRTASLVGVVAITSILLAPVLRAAEEGAEEDDGFPKLKLGAVLDLRAVATDEDVSFMEAGLGKGRYGAEEPGESRTILRIPQAILLLNALATDELTGRVQANVNADPDPLFVNEERKRLRLTEAVVQYKPVLSPTFRLTSRLGFVFPFTVEHTAKGWLPAYSITPSAANAWIGEEVRPTALELGFVAMPEGHELSMAAAGFVANDTAGTLLSWRGWALHDRLTGYGEWVPLAPIPSIETGGQFDKNSRWVDVTRDVDGHLGWWGSLGWKKLGSVELRAFYYDNKADNLIFDGTQYGWRTKFLNVVAVLQLPHQAEVIAQFLGGDTLMGAGAVENDFGTWSLTGTLPFGRHRLTARYDSFWVYDRDFLIVEDPNDEEGSAALVAYVLDTGSWGPVSHQLAAEVLRLDGTRDARAGLGLDPDFEETTVQLSFRLSY